MKMRQITLSRICPTSHQTGGRTSVFGTVSLGERPRACPKNRGAARTRLNHAAKFLIVIILLFFTMAPGNLASASANDFYFKDYVVDYDLTKDEEGISNLHVKEVLTAVFPETNQNHGITRTIPFLNQADKNRTVANKSALNLKVLRNGEADEVKIEEQPDSYLVYIGRASQYVHGEQVYTLEYDYRNVIMEFDGDGFNVSGQNIKTARQELYWDTNGTGWSQRFDKLTARLHVTKEIAANMDEEAWCYVGSYSESRTDRCTITKIADGFEFVTSNLSAGENLTFDVGFAPNTFKVVHQRNYILVILSAGEIGLVVVLLIYKWRNWRIKASEKSKLYRSLFVAPEYQPPDDPDIHVAEGEQLYIKKTESSYVATLLELVVSKAITITKQTDQKHPKRHDWQITLEVEPSELSLPQVSMLNILANKSVLKKGDVIEIKKHTPTKTLRGYAKTYETTAEKKLIHKGYLSAVKNIQKNSGSVANITTMILMKLFGFLILAFLLFGLLPDYLPKSYEDVVGGVYLLIVICIILVAYIIISTIITQKTERYMRYTEEGIRLARKLEGLELYIKMAEKDRLAFLQSVEGADTSPTGIVKLYEKLLPWASLFGQEESWLKELNEYYQIEEVPETINPDIMQGIIASNMLGDVNRTMRASTAYTSSSSYSSGGGSSWSSGGGGGGFSGGGGGGGGGGGW